MAISLDLKYNTPTKWAQHIVQHIDEFLQDHAACERKASGMAMSTAAHYPDKEDIVRAMSDLAIEELQHFKAVVDILYKRGLTLASDIKDPYVNQLLKLMRKGSSVYMQDRLLIAAIIEARGFERFSMIAQALPEGDELKDFYSAIAHSEEKHYELFIQLCLNYFDESSTATRLEELLVEEARICAQLPITTALH